MKKTIKCLFTFALTLTLGMSPGVVRAEVVQTRSGDAVQNCNNFCNECSVLGPYCIEMYCDKPQDPCFSMRMSLIECLQNSDICEQPHNLEDAPCFWAWESLNDCKNLSPICGDGFVTGNEQCDGENNGGHEGYTCTSDCRYGCPYGQTCTACGDGEVWADKGEQCDDGNFVEGDGCDGWCQLEVCGNNIFQPANHEQCDDGNNFDGDGCSSTCQVE